MQLIKRNPYRVVGLLVGATAREQERQVKRLKQFIEAEQVPQDDFSFPTLGELQRTVENIADASSKLNLDSDKMNAALFWFYKGNAITDEPAFEAIKDGDLNQVVNIWTKLTSNGEVSQRNASAYNNLGTLYLSGILAGTNTNEALLEQGISLKIKFLDSNFIKDFKALATDETYRTTKTELQLLFLNQVQGEIEKSSSVSAKKFLNILTNLEFSAKEDFLNGFAQKAIDQIEKKIEEAKTKRKENKANAVNAGKTLHEQTSENLIQLRFILGTSNLKFASISDKVSDEILQCGIDYFSHYRDSDTDPGNSTMELFRMAQTLAIGTVAKQRCHENTENLQEWIDDNPEREKYRKIKPEIEFIENILESTAIQQTNIANATNLILKCKPKLAAIKEIVGGKDEHFINYCEKVVRIAHNMIIEVVKRENSMANGDILQRVMHLSRFKTVLSDALDAYYILGKLYIKSSANSWFEENYEALKSHARSNYISTKDPETRLSSEIRSLQDELLATKNSTFLQSDLDIANQKMSDIMSWQLFRKKETRAQQIEEQRQIIEEITVRGEREKKKRIAEIQTTIKQKQSELSKFL